MDGLVLSDVPGIVPSGVSRSCYQACEFAGKSVTALVCGSSNLPNFKSLTFGKRAPLRWTTAKRHGTQSQQPGHSAGRAAS
ncbi:hypothetical protein CKA37_08620 [Pseudomonas aeruginosa]|nr:hypothetical protein AM489_14020 [Pseudomonas aeruginosa]AWT28837.1 hypothetical protein DCS61_07105 [Pseudomonas aeruginosa]AXZ94954.1 hypothetical protein AM490_31520 [Pseudomonas aeruginosa]MCO1754465.1 hypothetical protein [Pseudomonas aeruginosa]MDV6425026.1 hypothetical protein [Pseudomonas aeruginosa]